MGSTGFFGVLAMVTTHQEKETIIRESPGIFYRYSLNVYRRLSTVYYLAWRKSQAAAKSRGNRCFLIRSLGVNSKRSTAW